MESETICTILGPYLWIAVLGYHNEPHLNTSIPNNCGGTSLTFSTLATMETFVGLSTLLATENAIYKHLNEGWPNDDNNTK